MKEKRSGGRPGGLTPAVVRRIRRVFDARAASMLPTDGEMADQYGISISMVRKVGRRLCYTTIQDSEGSSS
jgi:hypothetical protein